MYRHNFFYERKPYLFNEKSYLFNKLNESFLEKKKGNI